ncbi:MAG: hypothetical protein JW929_04930 [Anaerolineales bacterium]|nr:hypothetical protein [Anaerolineales bacterium]
MRVRNTVAIVVALTAGFATAIGYFIPFAPLKSLAGGLLYIAVFFGVLAMLVGVINLSRIHLRKALIGRSGSGYSMVLLISLWITLAVVVLSLQWHNTALTTWIVRNVQLPLEASLAALVVFALLVGGVRLLHRRRDVMAFLFLGAALIVLLAAVPLPALLEGWLQGPDSFRQALASIFLSIASGGGRGILLGMALGAAATGLRILIGVDRPYER